MAETPLTVDLTRLRTIANRVEQSAAAIGRFRFPGLHEEDLLGSRVGDIATPALVAARLDILVAEMVGWAEAARMSANAFEDAERSSAAHLAGS
ncbi:MAG: hypothetical protein ABWY93_15235 [Mycobacterium sp.]